MVIRPFDIQLFSSRLPVLDLSVFLLLLFNFLLFALLLFNLLLLDLLLLDLLLLDFLLLDLLVFDLLVIDLFVLREIFGPFFLWSKNDNTESFDFAKIFNDSCPRSQQHRGHGIGKILGYAGMVLVVVAYADTVSA